MRLSTSAGKKTRTSLDIPSGNWVRLSLAPAADGELELFCLYPTGTVTSIITARAMKGNSYTAWYHAGLEGDYELWYTINGSKSNSVKFLVQESQVAESMSAGSRWNPKKRLSGNSLQHGTPCGACRQPQHRLFRGRCQGHQQLPGEHQTGLSAPADRCDL